MKWSRHLWSFRCSDQVLRRAAAAVGGHICSLPGTLANSTRHACESLSMPDGHVVRRNPCTPRSSPSTPCVWRFQVPSWHAWPAGASHRGAGGPDGAAAPGHHGVHAGVRRTGRRRGDVGELGGELLPEGAVLGALEALLSAQGVVSCVLCVLRSKGHVPQHRKHTALVFAQVAPSPARRRRRAQDRATPSPVGPGWPPWPPGAPHFDAAASQLLGRRLGSCVTRLVSLELSGVAALPRGVGALERLRSLRQVGLTRA
jgi:hypothetical protein